MKLTSVPLANPSWIVVDVAEGPETWVTTPLPLASSRFQENVSGLAPSARLLTVMPPTFAAGAVSWPAPLNVSVPLWIVTGAPVAPTSAAGMVIA